MEVQVRKTLLIYVLDFSDNAKSYLLSFCFALLCILKLVGECWINSNIIDILILVINILLYYLCFILNIVWVLI
jgi:hypothetical protein